MIHGSASEAILTMMVAACDKYLRETTPAAFVEDDDDTITTTEEEREDLLGARRAG